LIQNSELEIIKSKPIESEFYSAHSDRQDPVSYITPWGMISLSILWLPMRLR